MLLLGSSGTGSHGDIAKAVDFDGTNDYLSRASDLTGNADGKTFTFSAWVWPNAVGGTYSIYTNWQYGCRFRLDTSNRLNMFAYDSGNTLRLQLLSSVALPLNTWSHILVSIDMANTSNRAVYINDVADSSVTWTTYVNADINFTNTLHQIGIESAGSQFLGRLAHVFLDYTYRDLSNVTNRRLFITSDRKPAQGQAALNPILYLPMDDPSTAHVNQGTGGNFTLNGTIARSGRGPSQFNAPYSDLDGSADYLSRGTALTGVSDGAQITFQAVINADGFNGYIFGIEQSNTLKAQIYYESETSLKVILRNSAATILLNATAVTKNHILRNSIITVSVDLSDTGKRHIYCNGEAASVTWTTYTNGSVMFSGNQVTVGARAGGASNFFNGRLGNVFFHTSYIDLSVPANLAKFVSGTGIDAKPVDMGANGELPLGTTPLIYLPMYGNNAGKNYGTGGDFTVNSGPYPGARGPNEFWGNKADFDGSTGYLVRTSALTGVSDGKTFSCSFSVNIDVNANRYIFLIANGASERLRISWTSAAPTFEIAGTTSGGSSTLYATCGTTLSAGTQYFVHICIDLTNTANRKVYINNALDSTTWTTYNNNTMELSAPNQRIGIDAGTTSKLDGKLSEFYFTTDYIDFSQEANRLLFRDAFGNPTDLPAAIAKGTVPNPAIYMRFDPANQGLNSGTGGDFTKSGTITDGGQL